MEDRIGWIDFAKGFTILFVVFGHTVTCMNGPVPHIMTGINMLIFTFIMPAFFAISGYLYKSISSLKNMIFFIYKKISCFLFPYLVFNFVIYFVRLDNNINFLLNIFVFPLEYTWFLYVLLCIFIIFGLMDYFNLKNFVKASIIVTLYVVSFFLHNPSAPEYSGIFLVFIFIPFFFMGYLMKSDYINVNKLFYNKFILVLAIVIFLVLELFFRNVFHISGYGTNMTPINFVPKIIIVLILFYVFQLVKKKNVLDTVGKNSMIVYLVHYPVLVTLSNLFIGKIYILRLIICFSLSLSASFLCIKLCKFSLIKGIFYSRSWIDPLVKRTRFGKWIFSEN